jgi:hypothetical protein
MLDMPFLQEGLTLFDACFVVRMEPSTPSLEDVKGFNAEACLSCRAVILTVLILEIQRRHGPNDTARAVERCVSDFYHWLTSTTTYFDVNPHSIRSLIICTQKFYMWDSKIDASAWGPSFCHLFLMIYGRTVFPDLHKKNWETRTITEVQPSIFGFKVHPASQLRYYSEDRLMVQAFLEA